MGAGYAAYASWSIIEIVTSMTYLLGSTTRHSNDFEENFRLRLMALIWAIFFSHPVHTRILIDTRVFLSSLRMPMETYLAPDQNRRDCTVRTRMLCMYLSI